LSELEITDWRRRVAEIYSAVRGEAAPASAHAVWCAGRDELFRCHAQSPLPREGPLRRHGSAGEANYGGGRYALDIAKGADLGGARGGLIVDLNFLYHPSCRYSDAWTCPLAPAGNTIRTPVIAGEHL
jgi:hypothetical protein